MGTVIRAEVSNKNKYWIEKHRYYELKHFCLQYPIWKKSYAVLDGFNQRPLDLYSTFSKGSVSDPVARCVEAKLFYSERMDMLKQAAIDTAPDLSDYILKGVTEGISYDYLKSRLDIPCCKDVYYDLYRRFFWLLSRARE